MKNKLINKGLAWIFILSMVLSLMPISAFAQGESCEHVERTETVLMEATCTQMGILKSVCDDCNDTKYVQIPAHHTAPLEGVVVKEPTCALDGSKVYTCVVCKAEVKESIPATGEHQYAEEVVIPATCTEPMKMGFACTVCGQSQTGKDPVIVEGSVPLGHDYSDWEITGEATCTEAGSRTRTCSRCGDEDTEEIAALGHDYQSTVIPANCTDNATEVETCIRCGEKNGDGTDLYEAMGGAQGGEISAPYKATGHSYEEGAYVHEETTEGTDAKHYQVCTVCGEQSESASCSFEESVENATCAHVTITTKTCSDCGYSYKEETGEIDGTSHNYGQQVVMAATCTTQGIQKQVCKDCGATGSYSVIPASHIWGEDTVITEATCAQAGLATHTCTVCGETEEVVIEATGEHNYVETVKNADCENPAKVGYFCSVCGEKDSDRDEQNVEGSVPLGHDYGDWEVTEEATCTEAGSRTRTCSRCGDEDTEEIAALGHDYQSTVIPANCTDNAMEVETCIRCGEKNGDGTDLYEAMGGEQGGEASAPYKATGHSYEEGAYVHEETTEGTDAKHYQVCTVCGEQSESASCSFEESVENATCAHVTITTKTCSDCGYSYKEETGEIDGTSHNYGQQVVMAATCTTQGIQKQVCKDCGATGSYSVIPASHVWGEDTVITEATCAQAGLATHTCTVCGETEEVAIEATGEHNYVETVKNADCENPAKVGYFCSVCGEKDSDRDEQNVEGSVPLGHDYGEWEVTEEATCTEAGSRTRTCSRCGNEDTEEIAALGHDYQSTVIPANCTDNATEVETCIRCGVKNGEGTDLYEAMGGAQGGEASAPFKATGHSYEEGAYVHEETTEGTEAKHYQVCTVCGEQSESVACSFGQVIVTDANCQNSGFTSNTCEDCGYTYKKANQGSINADNHLNYHMVTVVEATCTSQGIEKKVCDDCGKAFGYTTSSVAHSWGQEYGAPNAGAVLHKCEKCGTIEVVALLDPDYKLCDGEHTPVDVPEVKPTEDQEGTTAGTKCSICGEILSGCEPIPVHSHNYVAGEVVEATCTEGGYTVYTCEGCADSYRGDEVAALGHVWGEDEVEIEDGQPHVYHTCTLCNIKEEIELTTPEP